MDQTGVHLIIDRCPGKIHVRTLCWMNREKRKKKLLFEVGRKESKRLSFQKLLE